MRRRGILVLTLIAGLAAFASTALSRIRPYCLAAAASLLLVLGHAPALAFTVDIGASTAGTLYMNQSFNETRAVDIKVLTSDLLVLSMTLREFNIAEGLGT